MSSTEREGSQPQLHLAAGRAARDRRRSRRIDLCVPVRWRGREGAARTSALGDLARGGLFVRTTDALERGDQIAGSFLLPRGREHILVVFRAEVAWRSPAGTPSALGPGVGVRFTQVATSAVPPNSIARHLQRSDVAAAAPRRHEAPRKEIAVERLLAACRTPQARVRFFGSRVFA
ncbi:MAG: PilZ domain-containing protein [Myxococcales bacterium]|nr:PilZ domain-containing protein [Myxococcales bacterium]